MKRRPRLARRAGLVGLSLAAHVLLLMSLGLKPLSPVRWPEPPAIELTLFRERPPQPPEEEEQAQQLRSEPARPEAASPDPPLPSPSPPVATTSPAPAAAPPSSVPGGSSGPSGQAAAPSGPILQGSGLTDRERAINALRTSYGCSNPEMMKLSAYERRACAQNAVALRTAPRGPADSVPNYKRGAFEQAAAIQRDPQNIPGTDCIFTGNLLIPLACGGKIPPAPKPPERPSLQDLRLAR